MNNFHLRRKSEEDKEKEEGWKQAKRSKSNPKTSNPAGQGKGKGNQSKGNSASQNNLPPKYSGNMFGPFGSVSQEIPKVVLHQREMTENARTEDKESTKVAETKDSRQGERESEKSKDKHTVSDVEIQGSEESEEEGEIGDS